MEGPLQLVPVLSLVPLSHIHPMNSLAKKFWHIICKARFIFPCGLHILRVSVFLVSFDNKLFVNIALEVVPTLPMMQKNIEFPHSAPLPASEEKEPLMLLHGTLPLVCGIFELPSCARCFLGYSCKAHGQEE